MRSKITEPLAGETYTRTCCNPDCGQTVEITRGKNIQYCPSCNSRLE